LEVIDQLKEARQKIRKELRQDVFSIRAKFSGDYPCLCGKLISLIQLNHHAIQLLSLSLVVQVSG